MRQLDLFADLPAPETDSDASVSDAATRLANIVITELGSVPPNLRKDVARELERALFNYTEYEE